MIHGFSGIEALFIVVIVKIPGMFSLFYYDILIKGECTCLSFFMSLQYSTYTVILIEDGGSTSLKMYRNAMGIKIRMFKIFSHVLIASVHTEIKL